MKHTHTEPITWTKTRKHKRPPRVFVTCSVCGREFQAVPNVNGKIDEVFTTGKLPSGKKQRNYRLTDEGDREVKRMIAEGTLK